jgi:hypothetical protein
VGGFGFGEADIFDESSGRASRLATPTTDDVGARQSDRALISPLSSSLAAAAADGWLVGWLARCLGLIASLD